MVRQGIGLLTVRSLATPHSELLMPRHTVFSPSGLRLAQETLQRWEHVNLLWEGTLVEH